MDRLEMILSRPTAKPYRSGKLDPNHKPYLNEDGHVAFEPDDVENPKNWSRGRRWYITVVSVLMVVNATFASSSPSACLQGISKEFHVSIEAAGLVITLFLLGYCFGPLFFAPLSEFYGRRYIFYITFLMYIIFNFLCAWAPNFGSLLVGRFLTGTFVSAPLSNAPGVLADLWDANTRGVAMALFACMTFIGPAIAPVVAGFLQLKENWRWTFYVLLWFGGATAITMFTIPETYPGRVLTHKAKRIRRLKIPGYENVQSPQEADGTGLGQIYRVALTRPWIILFDPISFLVAVYLSVVYTLLYMLFTIYPIVFREHRGWNDGVSELPLIGTVIGAMIGGVAIFFVTKNNIKKEARLGHPLAPEARLQPAMVGGIGFCVTMFWFGWSAEYNSVHWIVPTIAGVFLATSIMLIFVSFLNYLTDTYLMYAASAIAANTVVRSAAGASSPLFTNQMFKALGIGGGASLIGGMAAVLAIIPIVFHKYGQQIRTKSKFAPTKPKKVNDEEKQENTQEEGAQTENENGVRHQSSASTLSQPDSHVSSAPSASLGNAEDKGTAADVDKSDQNAFGQPRIENKEFGLEAEKDR